MPDPTPTPKSGGGNPDIYGAAYAEGFKSGNTWAQDEAWVRSQNQRPVEMPGDHEFSQKARELLEDGIIAKYEEAFLAGLKAGFRDGKRVIEIDIARRLRQGGTT